MQLTTLDSKASYISVSNIAGVLIDFSTTNLLLTANRNFNMENTTHINLIDDEDEKDPLAIDTAIEQNILQEQQQPIVTNKHSHSLRRHVPRIIVKPIHPEKKINPSVSTAVTIETTITTATSTCPTTTRTTPSPSSRAGSSRRIQQQQQAKAAATATAGSSSVAVAIPGTSTNTAFTQASTMREVLASIPGFSWKPRRRSSKKISTAAQIEQTKDGKIDLETPDSILASTNLRALLNKQTFSMLPPLYQYNLIQLLPNVDREAIEMEKCYSTTSVPMESVRLGPSSLNNEFFARACLEWRERLSEGEFTPENQVKLKTEAEREKNKLDPWKLKHFEPMWGEKSTNRSDSKNELKITIKKSSDDSCTSTSPSTDASSSNADLTSCTNLAEQQLEFKLESKGSLTATIVKSKITPASTATSTVISPQLKDIKEENRTDFMKMEINQDNVNATHPERPHQTQTNVVLNCDKQTDTKIEVQNNIDCTNASSTFDMLRLNTNEQHNATEILKRGIKRPSSSPCRLDKKLDGNVKRIDSEEHAKFYKEGKQIKMEEFSDNVPSNSNSSDVLATVNTLCKNYVGNANANANDVVDLVSPETVQLGNVNYQHLLKPNSTLSEKSMVGAVATNLSKLQQFIQPSTSSKCSIINSTCDNISELYSASCERLTRTLVTEQQRLNQSQIQLQPQEQLQATKQMEVDICTSEVQLVDDDDLIEQKFVDAESYVLESGEVSTDSSTEVQSSDLANKNINESEFLFTRSLDHVLSSEDCDSPYVSKSLVPTIISSATTSSLSSSLSTSSSSTVSTASAQTIPDMQALLSSNALNTAQQNQQDQKALHSVDLSTEPSPNEIFFHVQHDWNFGNIKLQQDEQPSTSNLNNVMQGHQGVIKLSTIEDDVDKEISVPVVLSNDDDNSQCLESSLIQNMNENNNELEQHSQQVIVNQRQQLESGALQVQEQNQLLADYQSHSEYSHELLADANCDAPMSAAEMEVSSTVVTNCNSNDSSNELNLCSSSSSSNSSRGNIDLTAMTHLQQLSQQHQPQHDTTTQRQILVDSNGQIIGNFLVQPHLQNAQQLLQHATQQLSFQATNQHASTIAQHHVTQSPQKAHAPMPVIRKPFEINANGQHYLSESVSQHHQLQQHHLQQLSLQQQQQQPPQRHFLTQSQVTNAAAGANSGVMHTHSQHQTHQQIQIQQHHQLQHIQQQQHQQQQQQHLSTYQTLSQAQAQPQQKFISKQLSIIAMPRSTTSLASSTPNITSSVVIPSTVNAYSSSYNNVTSAPNTALSTHATSSTASNSGVMKVLPPSGVPTTIAQQKANTKIPTGKGRKATTNKVPPGAVNLERSYQICQAVIQNSPNRDNLKAQLRPPSAILSQQHSNASASTSPALSVTTISTIANSAPQSPNILKHDDISTNSLPSSIPPNVMGVGRPGVYKVIGPRMGFPRKKYVQRKPSPTLIRHVFTSQNSSAIQTTTGPQLTLLQQPAVQQQHELHQNGNGQYVLVHRANVGAADNQAPRASSAPPVPQNQNQLHSLNGITGRGRPASVEVDTSNSLHEMPHTINNVNTANIVRRNIAAGNIAYIESVGGASAIVDGSNFIVTTTNNATSSGATIDNNSNSDNCACSMNPMMICQQCGAFCHDDCINSSKVCISCGIR